MNAVKQRRKKNSRNVSNGVKNDVAVLRQTVVCSKHERSSEVYDMNEAYVCKVLNDGNKF
jgi:hypothetical protein